MNKRDVVAALKLPGVGPTTVRRMVSWSQKMKGNVEQKGADVIDLVNQHSKRELDLTPSSLERAYQQADETIQKCTELGISTYSVADAEYPEMLFDVPDYPPLIYVKGNAQAVRKRAKLAVVGTREASELGLRLAWKISLELAAKEFCVVSGLALGIDTAAHKGALKASGQTVAVLAHGLDQVFPKSNQVLADEILEANGALVSEYEIGVTPRPAQFVHRNRLQSGLSLGSIVVESGETGGSIYQGQFTKEQGRLLFVVIPGDELPGAHEFRRAGGMRLQKEFQARPVSSLEEILHALGTVDERIAAEKTESPAAERKPLDNQNKQGDLFGG